MATLATPGARSGNIVNLAADSAEALHATDDDGRNAVLALDHASNVSDASGQQLFLSTHQPGGLRSSSRLRLAFWDPDNSMTLAIAHSRGMQLLLCSLQANERWWSYKAVRVCTMRCVQLCLKNNQVCVTVSIVAACKRSSNALLKALTVYPGSFAFSRCFPFSSGFNPLMG
jgi:hypothetical protein